MSIHDGLATVSEPPEISYLKWILLAAVPGDSRFMSNQIIYTLPVPIEANLALPDELRARGVTEEEYDFYLAKVREAFRDVHGSQRKIFWISMSVVFVVTIPFVFYYLFKNHKEMERRVSEFNRILLPHGIYGKYPLGSKDGPGKFEFRTC